MQQSTSKPTYSIVIIVKNDRGITTTLSALQKLVSHNNGVETIVIDASAPVTLQDIKQQFSWVNWQYFKNTTGKRLTIPEQRNMGIKLARGSVVIFVDSDCKPSGTWFKTIQKAFEIDGHDLITGPIKSIDKSSSHDAGYTRFADNQIVAESGAANLAIRMHVIKKLHGFDEHMSYGEDVDFTWRARLAGFDLHFKKGMSIGFDWGDEKLERKRAFRYGTSRAMLYKKHPSQWRNLLGQDINVLIYPIFLILLPVTWWFPYYPLLLLVPMLRNRDSHPIRTTVSHLIYAAGVIKGIFKNVS